MNTGFYIDAGAGEPRADSVTQAFYERGWRGINVEPSAGPYERLRAARPEDINLNVAVGAEIGQTTFHVIGEETGLSTVVPAFARAHAAEGWAEREITVPVTTLAAVCAQYVKGSIHFLKVDVEGAELDVLRGADFSRWRPWIILLEAVAPDTLRPFHEGWDEVLLPAGYRFAHFDGLNRFYVADEHEATVGRLISVPVNVLDDFVRASERETAAALDATKDALEAARAQAEAESAQAAVARAQTAHLGRDLAAAQAASEAHEAELRDEISRIHAERDGWAQELFETNRYSAQLTVERQRLLEEVAALQTEAGWRTEHQRASAWALELEEQLKDALARLDAFGERLQAERAAAADRVRECDRARAEADRARAEADRARAEADRARTEVAHTRTEAERAHTRAARLADELAEAERVAAHYRRWVERIYASTSWRASRPLRLMKRVFRPSEH